VEMLTDTVRVNGSGPVTLIENQLEGAESDYWNKSFTLLGSVNYTTRQACILGENASTVLIRASQIYGAAATWESQINLSDTTIYDVIAVGDLGRFDARNTSVLGAGVAQGRGFNNEESYYGTIGNLFGDYFGAPAGTYPLAQPLLALYNCTILGRVCRWNNLTIFLQRSAYNASITSGSPDHFLILERSTPLQWDVSGWIGTHSLIGANLTVNAQSAGNQSLQFALDPVTHAIPGPARFEITAYNGTGSFFRNFTVEIPTMVAPEYAFWDTTSEFAEHTENNCTIANDQITLGWTGITHDFTADADGTDPSDWTVSEGANTQCDVVSGVGNHNKVVEFRDNGTGYARTANDFEGQEIGAIEWWFRTSDITKLFYMQLYEGNPDSLLNRRVCLRVISGTLEYEGGSSIATIVNNQWYHCRLIFNASAETSDFYLNTTLRVSGEPFERSGTNIDYFVLNTDGAHSDYYDYIDAVDYSWSAGYVTERSYTDYGEASYDNRSCWVSTTLDLEAATPYYIHLFFASTVPENTTLELSHRTTNTTASWGDWSAGSAGNLTITAVKQRYCQVRALLTSSNASATPVLDWINFSFRVDLEDLFWGTPADFDTGNCTNITVHGISYDFSSDTNGAPPAGWTVTATNSDVYGQVKESEAGRNKVFELFDNSTSGDVLAVDEFDQATGTITFWLYFDTQASMGWTSYLLYGEHSNPGDTLAIYATWKLDTMTFAAYDGSAWQDICNLADQTWTQFRLTFNCSTRSFKVWKDGTYCGLFDFDMRWNPVSALSNLKFRTDTGAGSYHRLVFDSINYSWSNYWIDTGYLSLVETTIAHDFTADDDGESPIGWTTSEGAGTHLEIIANKTEHEKVVECYDNSGSYCRMYDDISSQTAGTIEWWFRCTETDKLFYFQLYETAVSYVDPYRKVCIRIWNGILEFEGSTDLINPLEADRWYHVRLDFNCSSDTCDCYINGTLKADDQPFERTGSAIDYFVLNSDSPHTGGYYVWVDAVDYSWSIGYLINRSFLYYGQQPLYAPEGVWTSSSTDLEVASPYYDYITFSCDTDNFTAVYLGYHMSSDGLNWTAWSSWYDTTITLEFYGQRYLQLHAKLTTTDITHTPKLYNITVQVYYF